jgi:hypothetical protein
MASAVRSELYSREENDFVPKVAPKLDLKVGFEVGASAGSQLTVRKRKRDRERDITQRVRETALGRERVDRANERQGKREVEWVRK